MTREEVELKRHEVIEEAHSWIGTPYRHGCLQKGKGVDCARFAIRPYQSAGLIPEGIQIPIVARDRLLAGELVDKDLFKKFILRYAFEVPFDERMPADLITFIFMGVESHVAIIDRDIDWMIDAPVRSMVRKRRIAKINAIAAVYRHKSFAGASYGN